MVIIYTNNCSGPWSFFTLKCLLFILGSKFLIAYFIKIFFSVILMFGRGRDRSLCESRADCPHFVPSGWQVCESHALPAGRTADLCGSPGTSHEGSTAGKWEPQEEGEPWLWKWRPFLRPWVSTGVLLECHITQMYIVCFLLRDSFCHAL